MADQNEEEHIQILEDVKAFYFTLNIHSPLGQGEQLVCSLSEAVAANVGSIRWMRCGVQLSSVEFVSTLSDLYVTPLMISLTHLETSMCTQEVPHQFTAKCHWPGQLDCVLMTSITTPKEWPVQFESVHSPGGEQTFRSVGHGWQVFLVDNEVTAGTVLVFELADARCLAVTVYHPDSPRKPKVRPDKPKPTYLDRLHFKKTLRASHIRGGPAARMVSYQYLSFCICV